jgi:iron complex transport system substrate-binding protein
MERPDLVVTGASYSAPALAQEIFSHPALTYLERSTGRAGVEEKFWICGTPFTVEAVEALVAARGQLPARAAFVEGGSTDIAADIGGAPQRAKRP